MISLPPLVAYLRVSTDRRVTGRSRSTIHSGHSENALHNRRYGARVGIPPRPGRQAQEGTIKPMGDLMHWHGRPSTLAEPPDCCQRAFAAFEDRAVREAVHDVEVRELDERKRLILDAIANIEAYRDGMATVLDAEQMAVAAKVADHCAELIRKAACICPDIDVSSLGEGDGARFVKGLDARCGLHGRSS